MAREKNTGNTRTTYFDLRTGEFAETPCRAVCHTLWKLPHWLAVLVSPLTGLCYLLCAPVVLIGALCAALGCRCGRGFLHHTV